MTSALQFRGYFSVFSYFLCRFALKEMENALTLHSQIGHNATPRRQGNVNLIRDGPFVYRLGREIFIL